MNPTNDRIYNRNRMNSKLFFFLGRISAFSLKNAIVFFSVAFSFSCVKESIPTNVPAGAKFQKESNTYVFFESGRRRVYYDNGKIYQDCPINELGQENGLCKFYSKYEDRVLAQGTFENGVRRGEWIWNFDSGNIYIRQNFGKSSRKPEVMMNGDEGNEEGLYERFYENGQVELKGNYTEGYRNGLWQKYFQDGELEYTGYYKNGLKVRTWFYYYPTHKTEAIEVFDDNGGFTSRTTYFPDGTINCEIKKGFDSVCQSLTHFKK
ncbi:toxin-antitoxin system YwqK family antitoxin [Leptospira santarosai]|uniref:MORN repeat protein n=2 Tax=Leptospira santarosai TaxID=28183 RepID=A0A0E2BC34_9LEPT|nr:MORN repeat protein [Leptospira santarosai str. MOR084]EKR93777.1 MORN repeat protein [Leptospira santarosai str. CBC379]EKS08705.1 MORN repeat protein [Leptospira santarosai str. JET]EMN23789.1 MORN repeat protein [Leptospira santarosai serovar Arenal str. MAVJ 401]